MDFRAVIELVIMACDGHAWFSAENNSSIWRDIVVCGPGMTHCSSRSSAIATDFLRASR